MRLRIFILLLAFLSGEFLMAQRPQGGRRGAAQGPQIKGKVTGQLLDAESGEPIEFATVAIQNPRTQKTVNGGLTDESGQFKLTDIPAGNYMVQFSFVGYERKEVAVEMTPKKPDAQLGEVKFQSTLTNLDEVVVSGDRELIENRVDKIVYNSEQDVANLGGDATDVLRRTPLLSVDLEGNVSLRGSQNIQLLINGKPSSILASSPGDALQSIPADQIKAVEVITSPSAKYDGEGTAGIINIITKRKAPQGFAGNISLSPGVRSNRGSIGITAGKGRFGFNVNGSSYYSWPRNSNYYFLREDNLETGTRSLLETGINRNDRLGFFSTAGAFYDFNAYHSLTSSFRVRGFSRSADGTYLNTLSDPTNGASNFERGTDNSRLFSGFEWSLDYIIKFPEKKERELSFSYKLDGNIQNSESAITQRSLGEVDAELLRDDLNVNDGDNRENTLQADFTDQLNSKVKLETGAKAIIRHVTSDFYYNQFDPETGEISRDPSRSDIFNYDQDVLAGYLSFTSQLTEKLSLISGVRYEYTEIAGTFQDQATDFSNQYNNWLPSATLSYKLKGISSLKLSYNRRIQRPGLRFINPFQNQDNQQILSEGNPQLDPELTDNYEFGYNFSLGKISIFSSFYVRYTTDVIESFVDTQREEAISVTTFRNIGARTNTGINLFTSTTLFEVWTIRGGIDLFQYNATGTVNGQELSRNAILASGNLNSNLKLGNGWVVDAFGFLRGRRQTLQGFNPSFSIFGIGAKKSMWNDKGSLGIRVIEPFAENKDFVSELDGPTFRQESEFSVPFRSVGLTFSYKFGKLDFRQRQRRSKIKNDDQLSGGDDNNGF